ncbi:MAG: glycosyltransferase [Verrucomicrobia bacterium]|nr:glycosyltransferase [Verrucomicrobiota bacterium]
MTNDLSQRIRARAKFLFEGEKKWFLKGITYGPFKPDANGDYVGTPERVRTDLAQMQELGINTLRVYHVPPAWFLDCAKAAGMRVLISIPWAEHVHFLNDKRIRREVVETIEKAVRAHTGHPAILGYLVGNEIPTTMVRWLGVRRVTEFLEELINRCRKIDPDALYSYASYPPTEYLLPQNVDFFTFNVYLHRQQDLNNYLLRLQNLADDKPLVLGEFGMDTQRHTEEEQADMLSWHVDSVVRCGLAGAVVYAWTDEWFTGGMEITDWSFGLVTRDRRPKLSFAAIKEKWGSSDPVTTRVKLPSYPKVSVIVCSYNGDSTLENCLESLMHVNYPNYEVVLVDDGSTDRTQEIAAKYEGRIVNIKQKNMGLSYARNVGARAATGDVFAYTDGDCMADPDWLYYLVGTLLSGDYAGVGGPNISPPAANWIQACVSAAPGGPSHVLLTDTVAEHIPGCNMAFHRWAFFLVGGFDPFYRKAGDDVDFCWRLQQAGGVVAFSPAAIVWHYRRFTLKAFKKQQEGYGEAESMLRFQHLIFFGPTGTAQWKGNIYGTPRFTWLVNKPIVYHGIFGHGLFQSIYPTPRSVIADYVSSVEWFALTLFLFVMSVPFQGLRIVPYLMLFATMLVALSYMIHARIEAKHDTVLARLLVFGLAFWQPLARGWARYSTWLKFKRTPASVISSTEDVPKGKSPARFQLGAHEYWNEAAVGREALLDEFIKSLEKEGWRYSWDTGWRDWDVQVYGSYWWQVKMKTVTEYHGGPKALTRVQLWLSPVFTTVVLSVVLGTLVSYRLFSLPWTEYLGGWVNVPKWSAFTLWDQISLGVLLYFLLFFAWRAFRLKLRVSDLVTAAGRRVGLGRVHKGKADWRPPEKVAAPAAEVEGGSAVSAGAGGEGTPVSPQPVSPQPSPGANG